MRPSRPGTEMDSIRDREPSGTPPRAVADTATAGAPAWEEIAAGRYMPRRIRGSFPGRELG